MHGLPILPTSKRGIFSLVSPAPGFSLAVWSLRMGVRRSTREYSGCISWEEGLCSKKHPVWSVWLWGGWLNVWARQCVSTEREQRGHLEMRRQYEERRGFKQLQHVTELKRKGSFNNFYLMSVKRHMKIGIIFCNCFDCWTLLPWKWRCTETDPRRNSDLNGLQTSYGKRAIWNIRFQTYNKNRLSASGKCHWAETQLLKGAEIFPKYSV